MEDKKSLIGFLLGSLLISFSSGFGLVKSYSGDLIMTALSLSLFIIGFRICQEEVSDDTKTLSDLILNLPELEEGVLFVIGALLMSQGFVYLTTSIIEVSVLYSVIGGLLIFGGYLPTHYSINNTWV